MEAAFAWVELDWREYVVVDPRFLRPAEVDCLRADPAKAKRILRWAPEVTFPELVKIMVDAGVERMLKKSSAK